MFSFSTHQGPSAAQPESHYGFVVHPRIAAVIERMRLTPRQAEIAKLIAAGYDQNRVAERLDISPATMRTHLRNIYGLVGATSRSDLIARVLRDVLSDIDTKN